MRTGHDYLATQLHRIDVLISPGCQLCGFGTMNTDYLRTCSTLDHSKNYQDSNFKVAHLYWSGCHLMAQKPRMGVG
ncbi:hypothetical protein TNCT_437131 [Trichonephila clavata]|uniref:Uncharacterized protein n=1 Tax=Trichonephila clavata TaxID=2740835 RepID=A0A8X6JJT2_TRICU|nr:hypothetical protein TNCT_437131 [Trichonephila clavata]